MAVQLSAIMDAYAPLFFKYKIASSHDAVQDGTREILQVEPKDVKKFERLLEGTWPSVNWWWKHPLTGRDTLYRFKVFGQQS